MFAFMAEIFERLDRLANIVDDGKTAVWAERTAFVCLLAAFAAAPHSISATQIASGVALGATAAGLAVRPRSLPSFGLLDAAMWAFFTWSVLSSLLSYEPLISLKQSVGTAWFLAFYLARLNVRTRAAAAIVVSILIVSCMVSVVWTPIERLIGRGVEVHTLAADGPLAKTLISDGDTLLEVDGQKVNTPDDVLAAIERSGSAHVKFYRPDFEFTVVVKSGDLLKGGTALERLGVGQWKKGRNWRSAGFYGHYTTFAEVLQLIGSLAFGLLLASSATPNGKRASGLPAAFGEKRRAVATPFSLKKRRRVVLLAIVVAGISAALLLTWTRAPQLGFLVSAGAILFIVLRRKWLLIAGVGLIAAALAGMFLLKQARGVDLLDKADESTRYRQVMLQDGLRLWAESPKHLIFGVGMNSITVRWREWGMFEGGKLPVSHLHSTPLQLLVERGLPALLLWLAVAGVYLRRLRIGLKDAGDRLEKGILLGCFGGTIGFLFSGLVHYNLGDQEVAMLFFMLMGLAMSVIEPTTPHETGPSPRPRRLSSLPDL